MKIAILSLLILPAFIVSGCGGKATGLTGWTARAATGASNMISACIGAYSVLVK